MKVKENSTTSRRVDVAVTGAAATEGRRQAFGCIRHYTYRCVSQTVKMKDPLPLPYGVELEVSGGKSEEGRGRHGAEATTADVIEADDTAMLG